MHGWRAPHRCYRAATPWRARLAAVLSTAAVAAMAAAGLLAFSPAQPAWAAGRTVAAARVAVPRTDPGTVAVAARAVAHPAQAAPRPAQQEVRPDGVLGRWAAFGLLAALAVIWITLAAGVVRVFIGMGRRTGSSASR